MLQEFISHHRDEIIARCRAKVAARLTQPAIAGLPDHGVPIFLDQLAAALQTGAAADPAIDASAILHGHELFAQGLTASQVVHDYGDICQAITELAMALDAPISIAEFRTLNRCLDDAIAGAVTEYGRERNQQSIDSETARESERLGFLAHELRNVLNTATLALETLQMGDVGIKGSTGLLLQRSLRGLDALVTRALAEVRLSHGIQHRRRLPLADFIRDVTPAAALEAKARGIRFTVMPAEDGLAVDVDRQILAAVLMNLLQNAFKFTRPGTSVVLRVSGSAERVLIEVEDECGGLPDNADDLFRSFEQRGADRTGVGLGLAFCRWAVEANGGRIHARTLPDAGCVFVVDLPKASASTLAAVS